MTYKGYTLHIDPTQTIFGCQICYIKRSGLSVDKALGRDNELAYTAAKRMIDYWKGKR